MEHSKEAIRRYMDLQTLECCKPELYNPNKVTTTTTIGCRHHEGWYVDVQFWIFKKRIFVCQDCGYHRVA